MTSSGPGSSYMYSCRLQAKNIKRPFLDVHVCFLLGNLTRKLLIGTSQNMAWGFILLLATKCVTDLLNSIWKYFKNIEEDWKIPAKVKP